MELSFCFEFILIIFVKLDLFGCFVWRWLEDAFEDLIKIYSYTLSNEVISTIQVMGALNVN